jgi:hypothetical protein
MMFTTAHFTIHMSGHLHLGFRGRAGNVEALVKYGRMFGLDRPRPAGQRVPRFSGSLK